MMKLKAYSSLSDGVCHLNQWINLNRFNTIPTYVLPCKMPNSPGKSGAAKLAQRANEWLGGGLHSFSGAL
jgi:hypothetical protein